MFTITDIRAIAKSRFEYKYEKLVMIVVALIFAWIIVAGVCQGFVTMDRVSTYPIPDSVMKIADNSIKISYDWGKISFNDYPLVRTPNDEIVKGNWIFLIFGFGVPLVALLIAGYMYSYRKDRYVMAFQQKWIETGLVPDTDKI